MLSNIYLIYGSVFILLIVSCVLAIINWIAHTRISARTSSLEDAIQKRLRQIDQIKKEERHPQSAVCDDDNGEKMSDHPLSGEPRQESPSRYMNDSIQIVRNVRDPYNNTSDFLVPEPGQPSSDQELNNFYTDTGENEYDASATALKDHFINDTTPNKAPQEPSKQPRAESAPPPPPTRRAEETTIEDNVMDVVAVPPTENSDITTLPLYSPTSRDADFTTLLEELKKVLQKPVPMVQIDFDEISFLHDQELRYLKKIHSVCQQQSTTLSFINCDDEIRDQLLNDPSLSQLIRKI